MQRQVICAGQFAKGAFHIVCRNSWILRNSADAKGGIIEDYSLFHPVWLVEERKVVHDAYETPVVPTTGASQERLWLWKAEIVCQSVLFPLKTGAKEEKTAETLIVPHF